MASIALIVENTSAATTTYLSSVLAGFGHTVTVVDDESLTSASDLIGYELLVTARAEMALAATRGSYVRTRIQAGTPALIGMLEAGHGNSGNYTDGYAMTAGMLTNVNCSNSSANVYLFDVAHPILAGITGLPKTQAMTSSATFQTCRSTGSEIGTPIAGRSSVSSSLTAMSANEVGTPYLDSGVTGARTALFSWLYVASGITYTAPALTILENTVNWLLSGGTGGGSTLPVFFHNYTQMRT